MKNRCTFCGREEDERTKFVEGYEILESCKDCEREIRSDLQEDYKVPYSIVLTKLEQAFKKGYTTFLSWEEMAAIEFADRLGWEIRLVTWDLTHPDTYFIYKDKDKLPKNIQRGIGD